MSILIFIVGVLVGLLLGVVHRFAQDQAWKRLREIESNIRWGKINET